MNIGDRFVRWAEKQDSIELLVLIGSRARASNEVGSPYIFSDWDFQIATSRPEFFADRGWTVSIGEAPIAYVARKGRLGVAEKITALFSGGELDLVFMPVEQLRKATALVAASERSGATKLPGMNELATVLQGGYRILKGGTDFSALYEYAATHGAPLRLSDEAVYQIAEGFVCDFVSTTRKIQRGEFIAAHRWLYHHLCETNLKLLHELRQRKGMISYPDGRRLEFLEEPMLVAMQVAASPDASSLTAAAQKAAATFRFLIAELMADAWRWPDLNALVLRGE
jgi:hypothetical protein